MSEGSRSCNACPGKQQLHVQITMHVYVTIQQIPSDRVGLKAIAVRLLRFLRSSLIPHLEVEDKVEIARILRNTRNARGRE